jgi:hypothetical protein
VCYGLRSNLVVRCLMCQNKYATAPKTAEPTMMPAIGALLPVFIKWIFHGQSSAPIQQKAAGTVSLRPGISEPLFLFFGIEFTSVMGSPP